MHLWFRCLQGKLWYQKLKRYITKHCMLYSKHVRNHMKIFSLWMMISSAFPSTRDLQQLFSSINNLNPQFMWNCFSFKLILYELRKRNVMHFPPVPLARDLLSFILWKFIREYSFREIKRNNSTEVFKAKL